MGPAGGRRVRPGVLAALRAFNFGGLLLCMALFSHWTRLVGAEARPSTFVALLLTLYGFHLVTLQSAAIGLAGSLLVFAQHFGMMAYDTIASQQLGGGAPAAAAYSAGDLAGFWAVDLPFLLVVVLLPACAAMFLAARGLEAFRRRVFALSIQSRHRRDVSWRLVQNMLPAVVIAEIQSALLSSKRPVSSELGGESSGGEPLPSTAADRGGSPQLLAWSFPAVCILQSDIVGCECVDRSRPLSTSPAAVMARLAPALARFYFSVNLSKSPAPSSHRPRFQDHARGAVLHAPLDLLVREGRGAVFVVL